MTFGFLKTLRSLLGIACLRLLAAMWPVAEAVAEGRELVPRLLIIPSDPWTLTGAKGDEAMMLAVVSQLRERHPALTVGVVTATIQAAQAAQALGMTAVPAWSARFSRDFAAMRRFGPDRVAILGADVMDGYYSPQMAARLLLHADALARCAMKVVILGFSFNASPNRFLEPLFTRLHANVALHVRDRVSRRRLRRFSRRPARLVADAAFMLQPSGPTPVVAAVAEWAAARRAAGEVVLGFNMHPMLVRSLQPQEVDRLTGAAVLALRQLAAERRVAVLLISHDYRGVQGDDVCLAPIERGLRDELGPRLLYRPQQVSAAELKAIAGSADAVVTGRMHLAIAALGMGRPVAALTYQDKFQGLFGHFRYPEKYLLAPDALTASSLAEMMRELVDELPALTTRVGQHLPEVLEASRKNVAPLL